MSAVEPIRRALPQQLVSGWWVQVMRRRRRVFLVVDLDSGDWLTGRRVKEHIELTADEARLLGQHLVEAAEDSVHDR